MGAISLAQTFNQIGNECSYIEGVGVLKNAFLVVQDLIDAGTILAGHYHSDAGLNITAVC